MNDITRRNQLIEAYLPLAYSEATKVNKAKGFWGELAQKVRDAAIDGLISAARNFDESRGIPFGPYARRGIQQHMLNARQREEFRSIWWRHAEDVHSAMHERRLADRITNPAKLAELNEDAEIDHEWAEVLLSCLDDRQRKLVHHIVMNQESMAAICRQLGIKHVNCARSSINTAIRKMQDLARELCDDEADED